MTRIVLRCGLAVIVTAAWALGAGAAVAEPVDAPFSPPLSQLYSGARARVDVQYVFETPARDQESASVHRGALSLRWALGRRLIIAPVVHVARVGGQDLLGNMGLTTVFVPRSPLWVPESWQVPGFLEWQTNASLHVAGPTAMEASDSEAEANVRRLAVTDRSAFIRDAWSARPSVDARVDVFACRSLFVQLHAGPELYASGADDIELAARGSVAFGLDLCALRGFGFAFEYMARGHIAGRRLADATSGSRHVLGLAVHWLSLLGVDLRVRGFRRVREPRETGVGLELSRRIGKGVWR